MPSKNKIQYGDKDILANDEFDPKYGKERITILLDQQVVDWFRDRAEATGEKYQALIRDMLRDFVFEESSLKERIDKLEKAVFKKAN